MNTFVCVLKSGVFKPWPYKEYTVQYGPHHVQWLQAQFAAQVKTPHRFVCLTDMEIPGVETLPLQDNLPGWWSKLEIFRDFTKAAYVDLDTVILGDVSEILCNGHKFTMAGHMTKRFGINSSVMSWDGDYRFIYDDFMANKDETMGRYVIRSHWGDQDFIRDTLTAHKLTPIAKFQHTTPEFILSYKHDVLNRGLPLQRFGSRKRVRLRGNWWLEPRIICFHGSPKPAEVEGMHWIPKLCAA